VSGGLAAESAPVSLESLVGEALINNPEIQAALESYQAALERSRPAGSLPGPMISLGYASAGSPRPVAGLGSEPTARIGVMLAQKFPYPGKRDLLRRIELKQADVEYQQYRTVALSVIARLKEAYARLYYTSRLLEVVENTRKQLVAVLEVAESRYGAGKGAQTEILKGIEQIALLEQRQLRLKQEQSVADAEILRLLNRSSGSLAGVALEAPSGRLDVSLEELMAVLDEAPERRQKQAMSEKAELQVALARREAYPDFTISAGYFNMGEMPDMYEFRLELAWPGWTRSRRKAVVREQQFEQSRAQAEEKSIAGDLAYRVRAYYEAARTAGRLAALYSETLLPQADLAIESALSAYQTGRGDFEQALNALLARNSFEEQYHNEMLALATALARLEEITGSGLPELKTGGEK